MIELTEETKSKFLEHATRELPREACGLLAIVKGKQQYHECKNIAESASDFILDTRDYIRIDDFVSLHYGDIVGVLHSHPFSSSTPTMADKVGCEQSGLAWFIYSLKSDSWHAFSPSGYKAPMIGREFKHGVFDCYSAVKDWYKLNLNIELKDFDRQPKWWEKGQNILVENIENAGFYKISMSEIERGDIVLVNYGSPVVNHCAVYIGNDQVFHQPMQRLSSREIYGGLLKKNTRMVLRYKS